MPNPFTNQDLYNIASMVYGEVGSKNKKYWNMALSSYVNSLGYGEWEDMSSDEVLQNRFYAVQNENDPYTWAQARKFPSKEEENKFKEILAYTSAALNGKVDLSKVQFYFTKDEIKKQKKNKSFDFSQVEKTGKLGKYRLFKYKGFGEELEKDFNTAFAEARKAGKKTFMWNGKKYTTKLAE